MDYESIITIKENEPYSSFWYRKIREEILQNVLTELSTHNRNIRTNTLDNSDTQFVVGYNEAISDFKKILYKKIRD